MVAKVVALLFVLAAMPLTTILIMLNGWGLQPRSWGWIILGNVFQLFLLGLSGAVTRDDK